MTRTEYEGNIVSLAQQWLGVPFLHNGESRSQGVDCLGLLLCFYREMGLGIQYRRQFYQADWFKHTANERYLDGLMQYGVNVEPLHIRPGDVLYFKTMLLTPAKIDRVTHAGISVGGEEFIHAFNRNPVRISRISERAWAKTFAGAVRLKMIMELLDEAMTEVTNVR